jgi:HTH-type transcriptional regulator/antitoxin HipB
MLYCLDMSTSAPGQAEKPYRIYAPASLGAAIRHYRRKAGLSQADLAEQTGLHRSYLSALEQGAETEQLRRLFRVLKQLGVRVSLDQTGG